MIRPNEGKIGVMKETREWRNVDMKKGITTKTKHERKKVETREQRKTARTRGNRSNKNEEWKKKECTKECRTRNREKRKAGADTGIM